MPTRPNRQGRKAEEDPLQKIEKKIDALAETVQQLTTSFNRLANVFAQATLMGAQRTQNMTHPEVGRNEKDPESSDDASPA